MTARPNSARPKPLTGAPPVPGRYATLELAQRLRLRRAQARRAFEQRQMLRELGLLEPSFGSGSLGGPVRPAEPAAVFRAWPTQAASAAPSQRAGGWPMGVFFSGSVGPRAAHRRGS